MPIKSNCKFCNKETVSPPSRPKVYCSESCRIDHKKQIAGMDSERICTFCDAKFLPKYNVQKTCSKECRVKSGAKNREKVYEFYCKNCGKDCKSHRKTRTTYCSLECYHELIGERADAWKAERICIECSTPYTPSYKIQRYCSRACSMAVRGKIHTQENTRSIKCDWCNKQFVKANSILGKENNFCSVDCFHLFERDGNDKFVTNQCENCQKDFEVRYIYKWHRFCSKSCGHSGEFNHMRGNKEIAVKISAARAREILEGKRNHPNGHKQGYFDSKKNIKPIFFRSSWEEKALILLENNPDIKTIKGEPFSISYVYQETKRNYIPDFLIEYNNGKKELIEIKPASMTNSVINLLKFEAAKNYCQLNEMTYTVWTEKEIF